MLIVHRLKQTPPRKSINSVLVLPQGDQRFNLHLNNSFLKQQSNALYPHLLYRVERQDEVVITKQNQPDCSAETVVLDSSMGPTG